MYTDLDMWEMRADSALGATACLPRSSALHRPGGTSEGASPSPEGEAGSTASPLPGQPRESGKEVSPLPLKPPPRLARHACHLEAGGLGGSADLRGPESGRPAQPSGAQPAEGPSWERAMPIPHIPGKLVTYYYFMSRTRILSKQCPPGQL